MLPGMLPGELPGMLPGMLPWMLPGECRAKVARTLPLALLSAVLVVVKALASLVFRDCGLRIEECRQLIPPPRKLRAMGSKLWVRHTGLGSLQWWEHHWVTPLFCRAHHVRLQVRRNESRWCNRCFEGWW